jgi:molecular chaperone GrpE
MDEINNNPPEKAQEQELQHPPDKAEEYLNGWKRAQADLVNFKKDEARRVEEAVQYGNERILLDMIDIADTFETALQHAPPGTDEKWLKGIEQSLVRLQETLKKHNVVKIRSVGEKFDPSLHEAVQVEQSSEEENEQRVTEEYRAGYMLHEKVIRPARVKISQ